MRLVATRDAVRLTGLPAPILREWTSRRALIPADVPPKSQGSAAQYGWQTILMLRLAVTLRDRFHLQLQAHQALFASLRRGLPGRSFIALWDKALALHGGDDWSLVENAAAEPLRQDALLVLLNPHLAVLSEGFALPKPGGATGQLDLFPASAVNQAARQSALPIRREKTNRSRRLA